VARGVVTPPRRVALATARCPACGRDVEASWRHLLATWWGDRFSSGRLDCPHCQAALYFPYWFTFLVYAITTVPWALLAAGRPESERVILVLPGLASLMGGTLLFNAAYLKLGGPLVVGKPKANRP
jgi:hypothetical protein